MQRRTEAPSLVRSHWALTLVLAVLAGGFFTGAEVHAAVDRSRCNTVAANDTVRVTKNGHYENPPEMKGEPEDGCDFAYVVDFFSPDKKMLSFVPDHDWLKKLYKRSDCIAECGGREYSYLHAAIDVYRCANLRACRLGKYHELVGTYRIKYSDCSIRRPHCTAVPAEYVPPSEPIVPSKPPHPSDRCKAISEYPKLTVEDTFGVRMVIKFNIEQAPFLNGQCQTPVRVPLPPGLVFSASGTARFTQVVPEAEGPPPKAGRIH